jgi:SAM-dependent methyltransferase
MEEMNSPFTPISDARQACPACGSRCEVSAERLAGYQLFLCARCGLRSALEALNAPPNYDSAYAQGLYPDQTVEEMRRGEANGVDATRIDTYIPFFREMRPFPGRNQLLDVGCGGGRFCRAAARAGWKTLGIDVSAVALQFARDVEPLDYRVLELPAVTEACGRFDVITAFEVIEHQAELSRFLRCVRDALQNQGRFFCTVPAWEHPEVRSATRPDWVPPIHLLFFTRVSLGSVLRLNGFEVLNTGYIPAGPAGLACRLKWTARRWSQRLLGTPSYPLGIWGVAKRA